jgi:hypothetical protein
LNSAQAKIQRAECRRYPITSKRTENERTSKKARHPVLDLERIPLTTLLAVAYYAGVFTKQIENIETVYVQVASDVKQIKTNVQQVSVDVAVLKTKVENVERHHK